MFIVLLLAGAIVGLKMYLVERFGPPPDPGYRLLCQTGVDISDPCLAQPHLRPLGPDDCEQQDV